MGGWVGVSGSTGGCVVCCGSVGRFRGYGWLWGLTDPNGSTHQSTTCVQAHPFLHIIRARTGKGGGGAGAEADDHAGLDVVVH